jgi:hypothetical protein
MLRHQQLFSVLLGLHLLSACGAESGDKAETEPCAPLTPAAQVGKATTAESQPADGAVRAARVAAGTEAADHALAPCKKDPDDAVGHVPPSNHPD